MNIAVPSCKRQVVATQTDLETPPHIHLRQTPARRPYLDRFSMLRPEITVNAFVAQEPLLINKRVMAKYYHHYAIILRSNISSHYYSTFD
jgi:hypothetical protein